MPTATRLGVILREEFEADQFGTLDPWYFDPETWEPGEDQDENEGPAIGKVLERVAVRLNEENQRAAILERIATAARALHPQQAKKRYQFAKNAAKLDALDQALAELEKLP